MASSAPFGTRAAGRAPFFDFRVADGKIVSIEIVADPARLGELELEVLSWISQAPPRMRVRPTSSYSLRAVQAGWARTCEVDHEVDRGCFGMQTVLWTGRWSRGLGPTSREINGQLAEAWRSRTSMSFFTRCRGSGLSMSNRSAPEEVG